MIRCPRCSHPTTLVIDSRSHHRTIRRRRECKKCKGRFNTHERVDGTFPTDLFPIDQKAMDALVARKNGYTTKAMTNHLGISDPTHTATIINRLRHYLRPYGYTITRSPYRLKVLID